MKTETKSLSRSLKCETSRCRRRRNVAQKKTQIFLVIWLIYYVAFLIIAKDPDSVSSAEDSLANVLALRGLKPMPAFFKPAFVQEGRAERLMSGDWKQATELEINKIVDFVVLAHAAVNFTPSSQFEGIISVNLSLQLKCLNMISSTFCGSQSFETVGVGYTNAAALENATLKARPQMDSFVKSLRLD